MLAALLVVLLGAADGDVVSDDAYYYFEIARNAARGEGFSFDSVEPTNGFHPLWAWLLVPIYFVFDSSVWLPIRAAQLLSAAFAAGTALLLQRLFARHGCRRGGELAACAWLFNPFTLVLAFRGLETALSVFVLTLSIDALDRVRAAARADPRELAWLGLTVGLAVLARTENALWALAVGLALIPTGRSSTRRRFGELGRRIAPVGLAAGLTVLPWIAWSLATFGTIVQTSGLAKLRFRLYGNLPPLDLAGGAGFFASAAGNIARVARNAFAFVWKYTGLPIDDGIAVLLVAAGISAGLALLPRIVRRRVGESPERAGAASLCANLLLPLGAFLVLHVAYYAWFAHSYAPWYFLPLVLIYCVFLGERLTCLGALARRSYAVAAATFAGAGLGVSLWVAAPHFAISSYEYDLARRLGERLAGNFRTVGLWNAGRVGYFFSFHQPGIRVVNLDGLVNNRITALPDADADAYQRYLLDNVEAIVEHPQHLAWVLPRRSATRFAREHIRCVDRVGRYTICRVLDTPERETASRDAGRARSQPLRRRPDAGTPGVGR